MSSRTTLKAKRFSYGLVELVEWGGSSSLRYAILVNGTIKAQSSDLTYLIGKFDREYN